MPRLPVPDLRETLDKYRLCVRAIVSSAEQYERTSQLVDEFVRKDGLGPFLQRKLIEYAETRDNWVYQFWLEDMYLNVKLPLPVNSNPGMVFPRQYFEDQNTQLRYAARFISGILDYKVIIDSRLLPIDRARSREKGQPLCMEQYYRLFTSYRYPGELMDDLTTSCKEEDMEPEHVIVACKNQFFVLEVVANSIRLSDDNVYCQLKRIVQMADEGEGEADPVGILTGASRDCWARLRNRLLEDSVNRSSLEAIENCIFVLCLDKALPISFNHQTSMDETMNSRRDDVSLALQMIHGHGSQYNSCNRWFEKTMQFVIAEDGACGLCYEHSPSEGIAVVQLIEHLLNYMEELHRRKLPRMQSLCDLAHPRKLNWNVPVDVKEQTKAVAQSLDRMIENLDLYVLRFMDYGKEFPKSQNMSPDAYIQLALQLTYYRVHGLLVSTYESASIRRFYHGRVDNIRACSMEALEWCQAMTSKADIAAKDKMVLLRKAIKHQTDILVQAILGHGIDNHLLGLRQIAKEQGMNIPELFQDDSYKMSNHFTLSTSQVPTTMDAFMCYGPVVPDGYGACYNPHPNYILVCISSFKSCEGTVSSHFAAILESSFRQMKELCLSANHAAMNLTTSNLANGPCHSSGRISTLKT